jgi:hypothetical protein
MHLTTHHLVVVSLAVAAAACSGGAPDPIETREDTSAITGRVPMYELYSAASTDHFYTINPAERDAAISGGFVLKGTPFYVESARVAGTLAVQRFYKGLPQTEHFYTADPPEAAAVTAQGWVREGVEGYVYEGQATGTVPLYRINKFNGTTGDLDHAFTTSFSVVQARQAQGWGFDGVVGFVWAAQGGDDPLSVSWDTSTVVKTLRIVDVNAQTDHTYPNITSCSIAQIADQVDLNGSPGREVIINTSCPEIVVVDDAHQQIYRFSIPLGAERSYKIGETDASHAGKELIFRTKTNAIGVPGILSSVKLDDDTTNVVVSTLSIQMYSVDLLGVTDFDGDPGDEIASVENETLAFYRDSASGLYASTRFTLPSSSATFLGPVDTDGLPGAEVVVTRQLFGGATSISTVHLGEGAVRDYAVSWATVSRSFLDRDGVPGAEICFVDGEKKPWMIVDRTRTVADGTSLCP